MNNLNPKFIFSLLSFALLLFGITSCTVHHHHDNHKHRNKTIFVKEKRIPPGQHKKMHGDKSAKDYAPGQRKKNKHHHD